MKKKIIHVFGKYPQDYGSYNIRLIDSLKEKFPIEIISLSMLPKNQQLSGVYYKDNNFKKLSVIKLYKALKDKKRSFKEAYKFQLKFDYVINNPDAIFHFHNLQNINDQLLDYMIDNNIKYVISLRGFDVTIFPLLSENNQNKLSTILKHAWKVHSVCKSLVGDAANYHKNVLHKSQVIYRTPNLKDVFNFQPRKKLEGEINIFTLSRIHWKKCIPESLMSIKSLIKDGLSIRYHIIGGYNGDEKKRLIYSIHKLKLDDRVVLHGFKHEYEFKRIIKQMDLCWLPTVNEGIPNTLYFLLKSGVPCIASETDGIPEIMKHKVNGLLFEPYNFNELTKTTKALVDDNKLRKSLSKSAAETKLQQFKQEVDSYQKLYGLT